MSCWTGCSFHRLLTTVDTSYTQNCTKTDNYGTIDAYEVLNMKNKTEFKAAEYIDCADGRNLVIVTWSGIHDKTNANLASKVIAKFFSHFHSGEHIQYILVPDESSKNILVYKFENYEPQRTIMSF